MGERGITLIEAVAAIGVTVILLLFLWWAISDLVPRSLHAAGRTSAIVAARSVLERAAAGELVCGNSPSCTVTESGVQLTVRVRSAGAGLLLYEVEASPRGGTVRLRGEFPAYIP